MADAKQITVYVKSSGKKVILGKSDYKAAGGQGVVYCKNGLAYKVYHPGKSVLPEAKIVELRKIRLPHVLAPQEALLDKNGNTIGFTMPYVDKTEFLCKLFNKGFRNRNGITPTDIVELVKKQQLTLVHIHEKGILVVDYNEMNFLVDNGFTTSYFIDVDSYQTPNFRAQFLMESVRDYSAPRGQFTEFTDWFSWGVVTFWMYMGVHPYKGYHPQFSELSDRMQNNISVFDPDVQLPPSCQDWSVLPKNHRDWYERVFQRGERSVPPFSDGRILVTKVVHLKQTAVFVTTKMQKYEGDIRSIAYLAGKRCVVTTEKMFEGSRVCGNAISLGKSKLGLFMDDQNNPLLAIFKGDKIGVFDWTQGKVIDQEILADDMMVFDGELYFRSGNTIMCQTYTRMGNKTVGCTEAPGNAFGSSCKLYPGVAVQDIVGKCWIGLPANSACWHEIHVDALDGCRIVDAKRTHNCVVLISERSGNYTRTVITLSNSMSVRHIRHETAEAASTAEVAYLPKGVYVSPVGNCLEVFLCGQMRLFRNSPVSAGSMLYNEGDTLMYVDGDTLIKAEMKK